MEFVSNFPKTPDNKKQDLYLIYLSRLMFVPPIVNVLCKSIN